MKDIENKIGEGNPIHAWIPFYDFQGKMDKDGNGKKRMPLLPYMK